MLKKAYADLVSKSFAGAAKTRCDRLVDMGFEEGEAEANIEAVDRRRNWTPSKLDQTIVIRAKSFRNLGPDRRR